MAGSSRSRSTHTNRAPSLMLYSPGGFQSIGIIIANKLRRSSQSVSQISCEVYPGIYVREAN
jgi:hypothetical protein